MDSDTPKWIFHKLANYVVFEQIRRDKGGGGPLTAVHRNLSPVSVSEDDNIEVLAVQGNINNKKVRFINGYGPQENSDDETKMKFLTNLI